MSRILVTGGTGFIGSQLAKRLVAEGNDVIITGKGTEQKTKIPCISYSFHDLNWSEIHPIDVIYHQAAISDTTHKPEEDYHKVNVEQNQILFNDAVNHGCKTIVYASSCAVYGDVGNYKDKYYDLVLPNEKPKYRKPFSEDDATINTPLNAYGKSKILFDQWAMEFGKKEGITVVGLRYSNVYGPGETHKGKSSSMVWQLIQQMIIGRPKLFKWGEQRRDFVYIDDVVKANLLASKQTTSNVFNVGSGIASSFNSIVKTINEALKTEHGITYIENPYKDVYQDFTQCDLTRANKILKYYPDYNILKGVKEYLKQISPNALYGV